MGEKTGISWTHHTFNGWWGCVEAGPECDFCYARTFSKSKGFALWGPDAPRRFFGDAHWNEPLKWERKAADAGEQRRVFTNSMADVMEDRLDLVEPRARLFDLIEQTPHLTWLLLTKRPSKFAHLTPSTWRAQGWPRNVWPGTTAGTQKTADVMIRQLLDSTPSDVVRWISGEPLLEHVDYRAYLGPDKARWLILGGESHQSPKKARGCHLEWLQAGVDQCREVGAAPFVKQLGTRAYYSVAGDLRRILFKHRAGADPAEWPGPLPQEFPEVA